MAESPRVFISFSSRDIAFVRDFFYSLRGQGVAVWDYSQREEEIPWGTEIPEYLRCQVLRSDYFIPVVSANSADERIGRFTQLEVQTAVSGGMLRQHRILPVVLVDHPPACWSGSYAELKEIRHLEVDTADRRQYDELIVGVCRFLGVHYEPPYVGDRRLPFIDRLRAELSELPTSQAEYQEMATVGTQLLRAYDARRWQDAQELATYFLMMWRHRMHAVPPYYAQVVKGVCELHIGRFVEAETTFRQASEHPGHDENAVGGIAQACFRQGRYQDALALFRHALVESPGKPNVELRFNILHAELTTGGTPSDTSVLNEIDQADLLPEEEVKVANLRGLVAVRAGRWPEAVRIFERMRAKNLYDAVSASIHAGALAESGRNEKAIELLEAEAMRFADPNLYHQLARYFLTQGRIEPALAIFVERLCEDPNRGRQFTVEYARALHHQGRQQGMHEACRKILDRRYFRTPQTAEEFFYDGFANYLLGRDERAKYDYERSDGFCSVYYDELMRKQAE